MNPFYKPVRKIFLRTRHLDDFPATFIESLRPIIIEQVSYGFYKEMELQNDIEYLIDESKDWTDKQFIIAVADYIEKAQRLDQRSIQDQKNRKTYMKLIRN